MSPPASRPLCPAFLLVALLALSLPLSAADPPPAKPAPRLDASGDPLPPGAIARLGTARFRHGETVKSVAHSADGKVFVSSGNGGGVSLWDAATGKELRRLELRTWGAQGATLSPDSKRLAVATGNGILHFCDVESGKELWRLDERLRVGGVAFAPDGRVLFTAGYAVTGRGELAPEINVWETASGKHLRHFEGAGHAFAVSPDGKRLACGTAGKGLALWDVATGQRLRELKGHQGRVSAVAFAPDGRSVAAAAEDRAVRRWDVATGQEAGPALRHERDVTFLAFLPGGKELLTGGSGFACIWDAATGKELRRLRIPVCSFVPLFALSPDGKTLAAECLPLFWDTASGKEIHARPGAGGAVALSPDGRLAVTSGSGGVRLWDARTGKLLRALQEVDKPLASFGPTAFSPDGKVVLGYSLGYRSARLWDAATGKELLSFPCRGKIAFTLDGKELLDFHLPYSLTFRDLASGKSLREVKFQPPPEEIGVRTGQRALARDGRVVVAMREVEDTFRLRDSSGAAYDLWDARTGKHLGALGKLDRELVHSHSVPALSPDGKLMAVMDSRHAVRLWDADTGRELWRSRPLPRWAPALEFSPDGRFLAAGGEDNAAHLLETATGQEIHCFEGHRGWVRHVAFSPDGRVLASSSGDTTFLWDLTGKALGLSQPAAKELPGLWNALEGDDARRAYQAACRLALSVDGVAFLAKQLRADAPAADGKRLERLLADLDAKTFAARAEASRELAKLGRAAAPALRELLRGQPSLEARRRAETLLAQIEQSAWTSDRLRVRRAVAALERAGTAEGRQALTGLAEGPSGAWLTDEAKAALTRLGHGPR